MTNEEKTELKSYCRQILKGNCNSKTRRQTKCILDLLDENVRLMEMLERPGKLLKEIEK